MNYNEQFDSTNTFCISCKEIGIANAIPVDPSIPQTREAYARKHFTETGIDVTFFPGIHGRTFGLETTIECNIDGKNDGWKISPGHVGLILSHYMVWAHIAASQLPHAIVFEDDAHIGPEFKPGVEQVMRDLQNHPDWDIVYLGWLDSHPRKKKPQGVIISTIDQVAFGTHAMLISDRGAKKLLDTNRKCWAHIDTQIFHLTLGQAKWFVTNKSICTQRSQENNSGVKWTPST